MIRPIRNSKYSVSDKGDVLSAGKPMSLFTNKAGYRQVTLYFNGRPKLCMVHRLVAEAFIANRMKKPHVNHKDGNKGNNAVRNLEWCTREENMRHSVDVIGNTPWNKGKTGVYSPETIEKMAAARRGKIPWNKKDALAEGKSVEEYLATL